LQNWNTQVCECGLTIAESKKHMLVKGCSTKDGDYENWGKSRFEFDHEVAGEAVCCNENGQATRHIRDGVALFDFKKKKVHHKDCTTPSSRELDRNDSPSHTYHEAGRICEGVGLRLCRTQEEVDTTCHMGCFFNKAKVWIDQVATMHMLLTGCSTDPKEYANWGSSRMEWDHEVAGEAVCCNEDGQAARHTRDGVAVFVRDEFKHADCTNPSGVELDANDSPSHTYHAAKAICEGVGLRLCRTQEELDTACSMGCHFNAVQVWTDQAQF